MSKFGTSLRDGAVIVKNKIGNSNIEIHISKTFYRNHIKSFRHKKLKSFLRWIGAIYGINLELRSKFGNGLRDGATIAKTWNWEFKYRNSR